MKTLVVVTHPDMANSVVNKRWLEELRRYPERYTVHELHQAYPDWQIDVAQEQRLIEAHTTSCCSSRFSGSAARRC
ncbi:NAD(P)H-dependent oxidoreductase [Serratia marcescens]|nr:NAD(P)H-dependent oxidoreductase [Serratia marcescens]